MVPPDHALPHRAHEEDRSVATQTSRAHPQLLPCPKAVFQRRCRGPEQQSQSHYEKILRIPYLPRPRTRPLSFTCEVARARDHPRFLLTNPFNTLDRRNKASESSCHTHRTSCHTHRTIHNRLEPS